jgi:nitroreductase
MAMNQFFKAPISDVIKHRHSVRTYKPEAIYNEIRSKLIEYAAELKGPFDSKVRLELIDSLELESKSGGRIGTYGVIKGAKTYIAGITDKSMHNMEQLGYCMESLMLYAESMGLGSCWLGGTFRRSQFADLVNLKEEEMIPCVSPIGYATDRKSFVEAAMRKLAGSDNRMLWSELFFEEDFDRPLTEEAAGEYKNVLDMVRLAPSASNKQPWRILKQGKEYHLFLKPTQGYGSILGFNIQKVDIGIAMCHFEMTALEAELKGNWVIKDQSPLKESQHNVEYIISWIEQ